MHTSKGRIYEQLQHGIEQLEKGTWIDAYENSNESKKALKACYTILGSDAAHYVVDDKVLELATNSEVVKKTFAAMAEAGVTRLPFDPILIEFNSMSHRGRAFVRIQTKPLVPVAGMKNDEPWPFPLYGYVCFPIPEAFSTPLPAGGVVMEKREYLALDPAYPVAIDWAPDGFIVYTAGVDASSYDERRLDKLGPADKLSEAVHLDVVQAMTVALLMLNTRGVALEPIDMDKLNKQRKAKGKTPINNYHVVRLGHIYDREGRAHSVSGSGRHMPVHWRAGHVRWMRYGEAGPRNAPKPKDERPRRPSYIPPCLVNYDPATGHEPAMPSKEVTV